MTEKQNTIKEQNKINDKEFPEGRKIPEKKKIFLIGFMGCGKSTVASGLEALFGFRKIEMDKEIESREGRTISRIFAEEGEPFFRDLETEFLRELADDQRNLVISCGGGAAMREENVDLMKNQGIIVYLTASPGTILERTRNSHNRPLLEGNKNLSYIGELLNRRAPHYEKAADIMVPTDGRKICEICREIISCL